MHVAKFPRHLLCAGCGGRSADGDRQRPLPPWGGRAPQGQGADPLGHPSLAQRPQPLAPGDPPARPLQCSLEGLCRMRALQAPWPCPDLAGLGSLRVGDPALPRLTFRPAVQERAPWQLYTHLQLPRGSSLVVPADGAWGG